MSAHTREVFRNALRAAAAPVPFYETIGQILDLNKVEGLWVTLEFPTVAAQRISLGFPACYRETGAVIVHVLGRSGKGDSEIMTTAETIRPTFDKPYAQDVRLIGSYPPALLPADSGEWLDGTIVVNYEWDYVVNS